MDKVQFNTQMVNMRKTVKRAKVQLIHHLTRQIIVIRKKKGSGKQLVKNERRAGRLVKEIEVIKEIPCDEVTMSAIINKQSLQSVLDNANSTAVERGTARLIHHKLISAQVASFKDLVTDDLLEIGKRKEKLLSRTEEEKTRRTERRGSESSYEEGDDSSEDNSEASDDNDDDDNDDDDDDVMNTSIQRMDAGRFKKLEPTSLTEQNQQLREQMESRHKKSGFFMKAKSKKDKVAAESEGDEEEDDDDDDGDEDLGSLEDLDDDMDEMGENFNAEFRELSAEFKKGRNNSDGQMEKERKKSKGLDSLFVGKLSGKSRDFDDKMDKGRKNRPGQKERQKINIKKQLDVLRRPARKEPGEGSRRVALVDLPSLDMREKQQPKRRVIPGINTPFEKPKTGDSSKERLPPSQRPMAFPVSKRGRGVARGSGRGGGGGGGRTLIKAPAQASEILHPSWEAKKKKKEQESKILPFAGKKITFDD